MKNLLCFVVLTIGVCVPGHASESSAAEALKVAERLYEEGAYSQVRFVCNEMKLMGMESEPVAALRERSKAQTEKLAGEAYYYGLLLEEMKRLAEAKEYWRRGLAQLEPGDHYYEWLTERLAHYP